MCSRYIAAALIDYEWWSELHHVDTWINLLLYGTVPIVLATVLFFCAFWIAFKMGIRREIQVSRTSIFRHAFVSRIALVVFALLAIGVANATVDSWAVVRYFGGLRLPSSPSEFVDPIFSRPLHFYFFGLPFYSLLLRVVLVGAVLALLIYWLAAHLEPLSRRIPNLSSGTAFD